MLVIPRAWSSSEIDRRGEDQEEGKVQQPRRDMHAHAAMCVLTAHKRMAWACCMRRGICDGCCYRVEAKEQH